MFQAPKFQTVTFFGTVGPNTRATLISSKINSPYKTRRFRASFPSGTNRLNLLRFFVVQSPDTPTTSAPLGSNLLAVLGQVDYITGSDNVVDFEHEVMIPEANNYIAVHAENIDAFAHTIECQVTIEFLDVDKTT